MSKIRVGVVRGGPSSEYQISLKTGENVLKNLDAGKYAPIDILLTKRGEWYMKGLRTDLDSIKGNVDVVWNALHGTFGEDGKVQQLFESFGIPYTGSDVLASALGMHKGLAKERFKEAGMLVSEGIVVTNGDSFDDVMFALTENPHLRPPVIVKPISGGSSVATRIVHDISELEGAIREASRYGDILIEEYIEGTEATVFVVDARTRGEHLVFHPIEIVPPVQNDFFDYDAKYSGESQEICPGRFTSDVHKELRELALKAHRAIGARHYSRSDFIVSPKGIVILEINTLPGLSPESLSPKALDAGGVGLPEFFDHVIGLALKNE
jgi:D-alanine-D-alanine ligase